MHGLKPLQTGQFGSKVNMFKNMGTMWVEPQQNCSMQKANPKMLKIRKITSVPKSEEFAGMRT